MSPTLGATLPLPSGRRVCARGRSFCGLADAAVGIAARRRTGETPGGPPVGPVSGEAVSPPQFLNLISAVF